jgi:hypothetical protein
MLNQPDPRYNVGAPTVNRPEHLQMADQFLMGMFGGLSHHDQEETARYIMDKVREARMAEIENLAQRLKSLQELNTK